MEPSITPEPDAPSLNSPLPAELDLYTIPSSSGWFDWNSIHETERKELKEFFNSSSLTRNAKVYKEYRDFMICKYREEPERRLRFSDVRKALVGDVTLLRKVYVFLEKWGLINFGVEENNVGGGDGKVGSVEVRVEEGAPVGVKVVAVTGAGKALTDPLVMTGSRESVDGGFRFAPLASYNDVFGEVGKKEEKRVCGNCGGECGPGHYTSKKERSAVCKKCFENKNYGDRKSADDFESSDGTGSLEVIWTEEETLHLLESVLKHGDDWELVTQGVKNKNKLDCIAKLITLPLGEFVLGSDHGLVSPDNSTENSVKDGQTPSLKPNAIVKMEDTPQEEANKPVENGDSDFESPPMKKRCTDGSSIMKQVALIAKMVSPHIAAAAAEAAVTALCEENPDIKEVFDSDEDTIVATETTPARALEGEDTEMKDVKTLPKIDETAQENSLVPIALRYRAATATALGAAAARAKMLADQEEKELEHLMAVIIENQLKKLACKMKVLDDVQQVLEKESSFIAEQEEFILSERINIAKRAFDLGISRRKDHSLVKPPSNIVQ